MQNIINNIFISAGESSGDLLGADLARALIAKNPALQLTGMGGRRMQDAGVSIQFNSEKLAVVGASEVIKQLPSILRTWFAIKKYLAKTKPDLVILIDFPDTHFRIMKYAKKYSIPVLYYVSPQIWAWRAGRIKTIQKYVDHMAVLFSFEEKIYRDAKVPVTFVGHPLGNIVKPTMTKSAAYDFFELNPARPIVTLFPGSRRSEIDNHLSIMIDSMKKILAKKPETQFALMLASHFNQQSIASASDKANLKSLNVNIVQDHIYDLLQITDAAIAVSGTVTLEIALMQVPLCIIYKMKSFSFWLAKKLIRVKNIGLCNIVAEKTVAKELIQAEANAELISEEIVNILNDKNYSDTIKKEFSALKNKVSVAHQNSSKMVAEIAMRMIS